MNAVYSLWHYNGLICVDFLEKGRQQRFTEAIFIKEPVRLSWLSVLQMVTKKPGVNVNPWIAWFRFFGTPRSNFDCHYIGTCQWKQRVLMIFGLTVTMKPTFNIIEPYEAVAVEYCVISWLFNVDKHRCAIFLAGLQDNFDICFNSFRTS